MTPPDTDLEVGEHLVLTAKAATEAVITARRRSATYNDGRAALRAAWVNVLSRRYRLSAHDVEARLGTNFDRALDRTWPSLSATEAVSSLLSGTRLLSTAAQGILRSDEVALLLRSRTDRIDDIPWTDADVPLLDEVEARLSGPPARSYAHVVVDEAQNLTGMQWRMLARRCRGGTFTMLGDLAQTTGPTLGRTWEERLDGTGIRDVQHETLTVGYRTQDAVLHWANRLLWAMNIDLPHVRSVRRDGPPPTIDTTAPDDLTTAAARHAAAARPDRRTGVLGATDTLTRVASALQFNDPDLTVSTVGNEEGPGVVLITPDDAHGLEFDDLVVIEPSAFMTDETALARLYVALTRTRGSLTVVHARPLPPILRPERLDDDVTPPRRLTTSD